MPFSCKVPPLRSNTPCFTQKSSPEVGEPICTVPVTVAVEPVLLMVIDGRTIK